VPQVEHLAHPTRRCAQHIAELQAALPKTTDALARVTAKREKLRRAYELLQEQVELLRRRIYLAKCGPLVGSAHLDSGVDGDNHRAGRLLFERSMIPSCAF
jgi:hypothetical protein